MGASVVVQGRRSAVVTHVMMMILALLGLMALLQGAQAETYFVGGTQQWNYAPSDSATYYSDVWAKGNTFRVGDVLQFVYSAESHNVYQLPNETAYANCDISSPITIKDSGNDSFPLTSVGNFYYVCGIPFHCSNYGMKLSVQVVAASSGSPPPASPPTAPAPATPPPAPATPPTAPATPPTAPAPATPPPTAPAPATPPPTAPAPATPPGTLAPVTTPTGPISSAGTPPAPSPSKVSSASPVQSLTPLVAAALLTAAAIFLF
ncbi:unnamed protein product [Sphagnum compactum]